MRLHFCISGGRRLLCMGGRSLAGCRAPGGTRLEPSPKRRSAPHSPSSLMLLVVIALMHFWWQAFALHGLVIRMLVAGVRVIRPQFSDSTIQGHTLHFGCQVIALHASLGTPESTSDNLGLC